MSNKRTKIWIDKFQTQLFLRIALYFVLYQIAVWSLFIIERSCSESLASLLGPNIAFYTFAFATVIIVFFGFLFIYDALKLAHRIVGPLYRIRRTIQAVTEQQDVDLITLRKGDFLQELKDEFNEMLKTLEQRGAIQLKEASSRADAKQPVPVG